MEDIKQRIADHWDAHVCDYDKGSTFEAIDENRKRLYPFAWKELHLDTDQGKKILEVGVGSASDACFSLNHGNPAEYTLLDISPHTLEIAKQHLDQHAAGKNYKFVNYDAASMPFPDKTFDRVKSFGVIHHSPDTPQIVKEIGRVLKPGGDFLGMVYNKQSYYYMMSYECNEQRIQDEIDHVGNPYTKLFTKREVREMCEAAGLKVTAMRTHYLQPWERSELGEHADFIESIMGFGLFFNAVKAQE